MEYDWPGNVRELKNIAERVYYMANGASLNANLLPASLFQKIQKNEKQHLPTTSGENASAPFKYFKEDLAEKRQLAELIGKHKFNMTKVAEEKGISRTTLYRKLKKFKIEY